MTCLFCSAHWILIVYEPHKNLYVYLDSLKNATLIQNVIDVFNM